MIATWNLLKTFFYSKIQKAEDMSTGWNVFASLLTKKHQKCTIPCSNLSNENKFTLKFYDIMKKRFSFQRFRMYV